MAYSRCFNASPLFCRFSITSLCPRHMSFTSNYRKLRVSPNAMIKDRLCVFRPDGEPAKKRQNRQGDEEAKMGLLKRVRMLNTSEYDSGLEPVKKPKKSWAPRVVASITSKQNAISVTVIPISRVNVFWNHPCFKQNENPGYSILSILPALSMGLVVDIHRFPRYVVRLLRRLHNFRFWAVGREKSVEYV